MAASSSAKSPAAAPLELIEDSKPEGYYWSAYAHFGIHEEMLKDQVRTGTYRRAILDHAHLFRDKIVLDIGCGSGILSMFAAQAGAAKVIGIECSAIVHLARKIVADNGFADVITLLEGKVEEIELPVPKVDIILSEWMGYFLLYEGMLETVLFARDKWLAPGGLLFPDKAVMYLCGIEDEEYKESKFEWWHDVYGFDMGAIARVALSEPLVDIAEAKAVVTDSSAFATLDLATCTKADLTFTSQWRLKCVRSDRIHAFLSFFDIYFSYGSQPVSFSTGPMAPYTHWKHTVFYLDDVLCVDRGEEITGTISVAPNAKNHRDMDIAIGYRFQGRAMSSERTHQYYMR